MAKNKGTHGKGKQATYQPDEFVQTFNTLGDKIQPHLKKIVFAALVVVAGMSVWKFLDWRHEEASISATNAHIDVLRVMNAQIVGPDDKDPNEDSPYEIKTFASTEDRRKAVLGGLSTIKSDHSKMGLSVLTGHHEARILLEQGNYDQAIAAYKSFASSKAPEELRMSALEGVGYALEAKAMSNEDANARNAGLEEALQAFGELQPAEGAPRRDYSLYHQGRVLVAMGKKDEGIAKYRQVLSEVPESVLITQIEARLGSLNAGAAPAAGSDDGGDDK
jgi:predicted negative regulator of RcsB-dependent stress response